jgi:hypothetical protein
VRPRNGVVEVFAMVVGVKKFFWLCVCVCVGCRIVFTFIVLCVCVYVFVCVYVCGCSPTFFVVFLGGGFIGRFLLRPRRSPG